MLNIKINSYKKMSPLSHYKFDSLVGDFIFLELKSIEILRIGPIGPQRAIKMLLFNLFEKTVSHESYRPLLLMRYVIYTKISVIR